MSDYRVKPAHNQPLVDLVVLDPQPRSVGIQVTRRTYAASGVVYEEGLYVELVYSMIENATQYQAILTAFGLSSLVSANVTLYAEDQTFAAKRWNGRVVRPDIGRNGARENYFLRDVVFLVKDLTAAT
jgi:hypothetical protein